MVLDQALHYCDHCGFGQLENIIEPKILYNDTYKTRTTGSSAMGAIDVFLNFVDNNFQKNMYQQSISEAYYFLWI